MKFQDQVIRATQRATEALFRTAKAMPPEKLDWKPLDSGRSALDQLQECAQIPAFFARILAERRFPELDEGFFEAAGRERQAWDSIAACERESAKNNEALFEAIRALSDEALEVEVMIPGRDRAFTLADLMLSHYANTQYHTGQINYIQTLYGDFESH